MVSVITQLSLNIGMRAWGYKAYTAIQSEMNPLHFWNTLKPNHWRELTHTKLQTVLESHMFLKKKRYGAIKGRAVAGGNKQCDYISKEYAGSPNVATEAVLMSCIIDEE